MSNDSTNNTGQSNNIMNEFILDQIELTNINFNDNESIINTIHNVLENIRNNSTILNSLSNNNNYSTTILCPNIDYSEYDFENDFEHDFEHDFDSDSDNNSNHDDNTYIQFDIMIYNDEIVKYFKSCNHINSVLGKAINIKANDSVLDDNCMICMEKYKIRQFKRIIPKCNHFFHKKCIDKWLKKKASCPVCRCDLLEQKQDDQHEQNITNLSVPSQQCPNNESIDTSQDTSQDTLD
jgi:hypothetical protein